MARLAQHATATCCRKCIQKRHGIEKGRALNEIEVEYVVALIMGWIEGQLDEKDIPNSIIRYKNRRF